MDESGTACGGLERNGESDADRKSSAVAMDSFLPLLLFPGQMLAFPFFS
jgi:hypothetical protein